jgi:ferredoxin/flavodoxin
MDIEIYYFTGTGNSLIVARGIAEKTKGKLIPIASLTREKAIKPNAAIIGIVFPVYYVDIPVIIKKFAERLDNISNKYIFAVCTYGGGAGNSLKSLRQIIRSRGGELSAMYGIHMPQNGFHKPWENRPLIFQKCQKKLGIISKNILLKQKGMLLSDRLAYFVLYPIQMIAKSAFRKYLVKISGSTDLPTEDLIYQLDKSYYTNEKCNGCGICSQVCPVNNIQIGDNKPVWLNHCETCLACYHWCPNKAIHGGITPPKDYYYQHPDIKVSDIMKQKG